MLGEVLLTTARETCLLAIPELLALRIDTDGAGFFSEGLVWSPKKFFDVQLVFRNKGPFSVFSK